MLTVQPNRLRRYPAAPSTKTRQVCHRDLGMALAAISGHLRRSNNDFLDGLVQEAFLLPCKRIVSTYSFSCILPAFCCRQSTNCVENPFANSTLTGSLREGPIFFFKTRQAEICCVR